MPAEDLAAAIARKELKRITAIPGIGKKTAERLLLELEGKLGVAPSTGVGQPHAAASSKKGSSRSPKAETLATALVRMGYKQAQADKAVDALADRVETTELADLLREALGVLAG